MNIIPHTMTISQLLASRCQFEIPRFQREYSWEKNNNKEFFDDMISCLNLQEGIIKESSYFLGTMLFVGDIEMAGKTLDVVDGQQRLTTITILFSAISDHFREMGNNKLSDTIFRYIMTEDDNGIPVRILKSNTHYPFFSYFIQDITKKDKVPPSSEEELCISETYEYLYNRTSEKKLRDTLRNTYGKKIVDSVKYEDILKALRDQVLQTLVIIITTKDKEEANAIFEILNAKGKRLANVDLIKNQIFSVCKTTEPADYAEVTWKSIKEKLNSGRETIGIATFYRHYWISKYASTSEKKLYEKFKSMIKPANEAIYKEFLKDLQINSNYYMQIINPSRGDYGNRKEYFWLVQSLNLLSNTFNITIIRIALMAALEKKNEEVLSAKKLKELVLYIEGFHFVYNTLLAKKSNSINSVYAKFARNLRSSVTKEECNRCVDDFIKQMDKYYPDEMEFKKSFKLLSYSKCESPDNVKSKYIINKLECYFSSDKHEIFDDNGTIEHLIPEESQGETLQIGNLILLERTLNNMAGDLDYNTKKELYMKSKYTWIHKFVKKHETWSHTDIANRTEQLADIYYHCVLGRS